MRRRIAIRWETVQKAEAVEFDEEETAREILQLTRTKIVGFRMTMLAASSLLDAEGVARGATNDGVAGFAIIHSHKIARHFAAHEADELFHL